MCPPCLDALAVINVLLWLGLSCHVHARLQEAGIASMKDSMAFASMLLAEQQRLGISGKKVRMGVSIDMFFSCGSAVLARALMTCRP